MPPRPQELSWSDSTIEKLAIHFLTIADAFAVLERAPIFLTQGSLLEQDDSGRIRSRPERIRMIGPGRTDQILTFVLEYPDLHGESFMVTGYASPRHDRESYVQLRRRNR